MVLRRFIAVLAIWSALAGAAGAQLQAAPAAGPPAVSAIDIDALAASLEDPTARAKLVQQLRLLADAQRSAAPVESAGVVERLLAGLSAGIATIGDDLAEAALALKDVPRVGAWFERQLHEPALIEQWSILFAQLAAVLAAAMLAEWLVDRVTAGARQTLDGLRGGVSSGEATLPVRGSALIIRTILGLVPIVAFVGAAYLALALIRPDPMMRLVTLALIHANVLVRAILAVARVLLGQRDTGYRLVRLSEETAAYVYLWIRRLVSVLVYGFFLVEAARLLGVPLGIDNVALRALGLVATAMIVILTLQNRAAVADGLGRGHRRDGRAYVVSGVGRRIVDVWHILVILYVAAIYLVWAVGMPGGFGYLVRGTALTLVIALLTRAGTALLRRAIELGFAVGTDLKQRLPGLEARANRYLPLLSAVLRGAIYLVAGVALLQAWGADSFGWLGSETGRRMMSGGLSIVIVVAVAVLAWELLALVIERYLGETDEDGKALPRSARMRTLLPLVRNASMILIIVMVGLIVLSTLGLDIAPLLAGAGVVGLAIGFGAQTLVKDVITGFFILIEDTINVGDVVQVDQRTGAVESISIRSIRIRDVEGAVHTVPFSAVSTVRNLTKGFSYYVFDIAVAQSADLDAVIALLRRIDEAIRADVAFQADILEPLDVQGVDKLIDGGLVVRARLKTAPGRQYAAGREFNRRIAAGFAAAGVPSPTPQHTIRVLGAGPADKPVGEPSSWSVLPKPAD